MSIKKNGIYWKGIKRRIGRFFEKVHECITYLHRQAWVSTQSK